MSGKIAFVLKGYPRLSETFIAQEILELERLGLDICIISLRPPRDQKTHPVHREIQAPVTYLPERPFYEPLRVARAFLSAFGRPGFRQALRSWLADMLQAPSLDRIVRFSQGLVLAYELSPEVDRLHAHFLHTPASVTRYACLILEKPWSCSAHAKDIWTSDDWEKTLKLREMDWLVTCTEVGRAHLAALAPSAKKVMRIYHGIDLMRFSPIPALRPYHDGSSATNRVTLLSVGRAVEKKGFDVMIEALSLLPDEMHWHWIHIGEGHLLNTLKLQAEHYGLADRISWLGACEQKDVITHYRSADLFVLPCRIARDGDRDGLPNVLLEAQSQSLACITTPVSAIPELIKDGVNGKLIPPESPTALAEALLGLIQNPSLREKLGQVAAERVINDFSHTTGIQQLAQKFGLHYENVKRKTLA